MLTVAWHPTGKSLLSSGTDGCIHCWEVSTGEMLCAFTWSVPTFVLCCSTMRFQLMAACTADKSARIRFCARSHAVKRAVCAVKRRSA